MSLWLTLLFWTAAALLSALAACLVLWRARRAAVAPQGEDPGLTTHRRQLAEIDDLVARGLLSPDEQAEARAEAGRRLLAADAVVRAPPRAGGLMIATAVAALAPLAALSLYARVGSPGQPDAPMAERVAAWSRQPVETLSAEQIAAALTEVAKKTPNDARLLALLAEKRQEAGDTFGAGKALREAIRIEPNNAALWARQGEVFVLMSNGEVGADARAAFREALRLDPASPSARYFLALADISDGQTARGLTVWRGLLAQLPTENPYHATLAAEIAEVERTGKPPQPQPQQQAAKVTPEQIRGMVEGLAARLEADPNDPEGWLRLVRAYGVLGETAKRDAALARARTLYKDQPQVLKALQAEAETRPQAETRQ